MVPTKRAVPAHPASFTAPLGDVLPSALHDKDAEDVKQKKMEEQAEEREAFSMGQHDQPKEPEKFEVEQLEGLCDSSVPSAHGTSGDVGMQSTSSRSKRPGEVEVISVFDDDVADSSCLPAMETRVDLSRGPGLAAPVTPPMTSSTTVQQTPRQQHATRTHEFEVEEDHEAKRAKMESQKKQKIHQLRELHESMIRAVKVGTNEYATMDNYEHEVNMDEDVPEVEFWSDEDQLEFKGVPEELWSKAPLDKPPPPPEAWVDQLADEVEIQRLLEMGVLQCSTLVDNVLSRHACKQCCDVQHVGLGYVGLFCVLPCPLPSVSYLYVPVRFLMVDLLL